MGYGVEVYTGRLKKCCDITWFDIKGGYSFHKFYDWDLEQSTIVDVSTHYLDRIKEDKYVYWKNRDGILVFRDAYLYSRKTISITSVIKDLKRLIAEEGDDKELEKCIKILEEDKKKGLKLVLFEGF